MKYLIFTLLLLLSFVDTNAQGQWEIFSSVNTGSNALPTNRVRSIQRMGDTMVFMNVGGLTFYDGTHWSGMITGKVNQDEIRDFEFASNGKMYLPTIWSGYWEVGGPNYLNTITNFSLINGSSNALFSKALFCVEEDSLGKIWFGTEGKGIVIRNTNGTYTNYTTQNSSLVNDTVYDILFHQGKAYIGTQNGLSIFNGTTWQNIPYNGGSNGLLNSSCLDLFFDDVNVLWIGTYYGLSRWNGSTSFTAYTTTNGLVSNHVKKITQDTVGNVWFACVGGLTKFDGTTFTPYTATGTIGTIPYGDINCIEVDKNNNLWVGTEDHGVMRYNGNIWTLYNVSDAQPHPWFVTSVGEDAQGGIWTSGGQEYFISPEMAYGRYLNGNWTASTPKTPSGEKIGIKGTNQLLDASGRHWITTSDKGLAVETNGVWQIFKTTNSALPSNNVLCAVQGKNGNVWVGTDSGLVKFSNTLGITVYKTTNGLAHNFVNDVAIDSSGNVWAATDDGISKFNGTTWTKYDTTNYNLSGVNAKYVYKLAFDAQQNLWASIFGYGILKFNGTTWTNYAYSKGNFPSDWYNDLMTDKNGNIIACSTNKGISKNINGSWVNYTDNVHVKVPNGVNGYSCVFQSTKGDIYCGDWDFGLAKLTTCQGFNPKLSVLGNSTVCFGDSTILQANNTPGLVYKWYKNNTLITGFISSSLIVKDPGNYYAIITDTINGCISNSDTITVGVNYANYSIDFKSVDTLLVQLPFNVNFTNLTPQMTNYTFHWDFGDGQTSTYYHPFHQYQYNGQYTVKLKATSVLTGCTSELVKVNYIKANGGTSCTINAQITPSGTATICKDDSLLLTTGSGTNYTYQWVRNGILISGANAQSYYAKQIGQYSVIVSNPNCSAISPTFVLTQYPNIPPVIQVSGTIMPCTNDSVKLTLQNFYNDYLWSTGDTNPSIWINATGYYTVKVQDQFGCFQNSAPYQLSNSYLLPPSICIIGVDSTSGKNRIIWERQNTNLIDSIVIMRESTVAGVYNPIATVGYQSAGIYIDNAANPAVKPWRYKLAAKDTCGALSLNSPYHESIHLTINAGLNGTWNLIWNDYEGFPVSSYFIYRGTPTTPMTLLAQVSGNVNSFTDLYPPAGNVLYQIEILKLDGCYPDSIFAKTNTNYNSSRSNTANNAGITPMFLTADFSTNVSSGIWPVKIDFTDVSSGNPSSWKWEFGDGNSSIEQNPTHTYNNTGLYTVSLKVCNGGSCDTIIKTNYINVLANGMVEINAQIKTNVYPNPNKGIFNIEILSDSKQELEMAIYNALGQKVYHAAIEVDAHYISKLDLSHLSAGVYTLSLQSKNGQVSRKKIIIQ